MKLYGLALIILLFAGCTGSSDTMTVVETTQPSTDKIPFKAPSKSLSVLEFYHDIASGTKDSYTIHGDVGEVVHTERYTYMKLVEGEEELWVATSRAEIPEGVSVIITGSAYFDFQSSSMNKTFPVLVLAPTFSIVKDGEIMSEAGSVPIVGMSPH
jgi:hypothetical protein